MRSCGRAAVRPPRLGTRGAGGSQGRRVDCNSVPCRTFAKKELGARVTPAGEFVSLSSVGLRNRMKNDKDEAVRKACYAGLLDIGPFICENGFIDVVKKRNEMAKKLGYEDFYE